MRRGDPKCETCRGMGLRVVDTEDGSTEARPCACVSAPTARELAAQAGVPPVDLDRAVEPVDGQVQRATAELLADADAGLRTDWLLVGDAGRGKSVLVARVFLRLAARGARLRYVYVPNWLVDLKATYSRSRRDGGGEGETERQVVDDLLRPDVLCLDDFGAEHSTPWTVSVGLLVLHTRGVHGRRTIVTTNHDLDCEQPKACGACLAHVMGTRVSSRLSTYRRAVLAGDDLRRKYRLRRARI